MPSMTPASAEAASVTVTFAGSGDAFGHGGRFQACIHLSAPGLAPVLLDCGATSLPALRRCGLDPGDVAAVFVSHLHGDHFGGLPFLILDGQFSRRTQPLTIAGPAGTARRLRAAMECLFPGSADAARDFDVQVIELQPGLALECAGARVTGVEVAHPSGAPALALRLELGGKVIAYTGDTAWTPALSEVAAGADLLIAEAYYRVKPVPHHLRLADIEAHRDELACQQIVLTHMSDDVLAHRQLAGYPAAEDGLVLRV
jgi:ribonuclease BN (tRNA processing enzyme)